MDDTRISSQPTIYAFLHTMWDDWSTRMSGPLTVPFTAAAVFLKSTNAKVLFSILAVVCALFSTYWTWLPK
jgi:hypothetical protein